MAACQMALPSPRSLSHAFTPPLSPSSSPLPSPFPASPCLTPHPSLTPHPTYPPASSPSPSSTPAHLNLASFLPLPHTSLTPHFPPWSHGNSSNSWSRHLVTCDPPLRSLPPTFPSSTSPLSPFSPALSTQADAYLKEEEGAPPLPPHLTSSPPPFPPPPLPPPHPPLSPPLGPSVPWHMAACHVAPLRPSLTSPRSLSPSSTHPHCALEGRLEGEVTDLG